VLPGDTRPSAGQPLPHGLRRARGSARPCPRPGCSEQWPRGGGSLPPSPARGRGSALIRCPLPQSYGPEHLLTFHNLKRIGLLTEQSAGETLTAVESKVSRLVTDRAAGESQPSARRVPGEPCGSSCPVGSRGFRAGWEHVANADTVGAGTVPRAGRGLCHGGSRAGRRRCQASSRARSSAHPPAQPAAALSQKMGFGHRL